MVLSSIRRQACILSRTAISFRTGNISSLESRTLSGRYCTCYFVGRQPHTVRNKRRALKMAFELSILYVALTLRQTNLLSSRGDMLYDHVVSSSPKVDGQQPLIHRTPHSYTPIAPFFSISGFVRFSLKTPMSGWVPFHNNSEGRRRGGQNVLIIGNRPSAFRPRQVASLFLPEPYALPQPPPRFALFESGLILVSSGTTVGRRGGGRPV